VHTFTVLILSIGDAVGIAANTGAERGAVGQIKLRISLLQRQFLTMQLNTLNTATIRQHRYRQAVVATDGARG